MKGALIAIEGIDGCGKGTVLTRLAADVFNHNKDYNIFLTREPYKRDWVKKFLSQLDPVSQGEQAVSLFVEDRKKHLKVIEPLLNKGIIVLCDRYLHSTFAYQLAQGISFEKIKQLHEGIKMPDLCIIIDLPASESVKRIATGRENTHAFEREDFLSKVRENYLKVSKDLHHNCRTIDGNRDRDSVYNDVKKIVISFLDTHKDL